MQDVVYLLKVVSADNRLLDQQIHLTSNQAITAGIRWVKFHNQDQDTDVTVKANGKEEVRRSNFWELSQGANKCYGEIEEIKVGESF